MESKRYAVAIVESLGTANEAILDSGAIAAAGDLEAVLVAQRWLRQSGKAKEGEYLRISVDGRVIDTLPLRGSRMRDGPKRQRRTGEAG